MNDWQTDGWLAWTGPYQHGALLTLAALPIAVVVVWALARRRQLGGIAPTHAWRLSLAEVGIVFGTVPFLWLTVLPGSQAGGVSGRVSLVPLRDLVTMPPAEVLGNLLVFAALGFFAPLRFPRLASAPRILALAATASILIETAQHVWLDRVSSVDDVLLNTAGAVAAALASRRWRLDRPAGPRVCDSPLDTNPAPGRVGAVPRLPAPRRSSLSRPAPARPNHRARDRPGAQHSLRAARPHRPGPAPPSPTPVEPVETRTGTSEPPGPGSPGGPAQPQSRTTTPAWASASLTDPMLR